LAMILGAGVAFGLGVGVGFADDVEQAACTLVCGSTALRRYQVSPEFLLLAPKVLTGTSPSRVILTIGESESSEAAWSTPTEAATHRSDMISNMVRVLVIGLESK
jgi:hypothetical protein